MTRISLTRFRVRWMLFVATLVGANLAGIWWVVTARSSFIGLPGSGMPEHYVSWYSMYDGSVVRVDRNFVIGKTISRTVRPPTSEGLCRVWWPVVAGAFLTPLAFVIFLTHAEQWGIVDGGRTGIPARPPRDDPMWDSVAD